MTVFKMQNGMEWIFGYRFYIGTANIEFECCMDFRISGVQDGVGVVEQNEVRVVGSLFSNRLDCNRLDLNAEWIVGSGSSYQLRLCSALFQVSCTCQSLQGYLGTAGYETFDSTTQLLS